MPNPYFQFKQFTVWHDRCTMKVGTDGVLLGAWANGENAKTILDVGTGSGLISLMLAQRYPEARIDAIDIDDESVKQATLNFESSPYKDRLSAFQVDYTSFLPTKRYDLIVCNPPYFINSLLPPGKQRQYARHTNSLSYEDFIRKSVMCLADYGRICLILPADSFQSILPFTEDLNLYITRKTEISPRPDTPPKRILLEFSGENKKTETSAFFIENSRHNYSPEYISLTKDFYLAF